MGDSERAVGAQRAKAVTAIKLAADEVRQLAAQLSDDLAFQDIAIRLDEIADIVKRLSPE